MKALIVILYLLPTAILFLYSCAQLHLVWHYWQGRRSPNNRVKPLEQYGEYPFVTVQLPIYNERYVIERLIKAVAHFDYPKHRFEIQILDDSTDDTVQIVATQVAHYQSLGFRVAHIRRPRREGFKAGALAYGLELAQGEFIAIFDADFVPTPDFLQKTVPYFSTSKVGVVQTRWGHLNESYSLMTELQAFGLDGHFVVEQGGRNAGGHFINFNGTAGIWRKDCINDAGGWESNTLTEDLDLSYRAQVRGWEFVYLEALTTPAELPVTMPALKSQQYRWMKGAAECARKNLWAVFKTPTLKTSTKIHAAFHLLNSGVFVAVLMMALLSLPTLIITHYLTDYDYLLGIFRYFQVSVLMLMAFYWTAHHKHKTLWRLLWQLPLFLAVMLGLSLHNAIAVVEGYLGKKTPFVRTPKWGIVQKQDAWQQKKYLVRSLNFLTISELGLSIYFLAGIGLGLYWQSYQMLLLHLLLAFGYGFIGYFSVKHSL